MLVDCDRMWGNATVLKTHPSFEVHWDSLFIPFIPGLFYDRDPNWGLYDQDLNLIDAAAYYRVSGGARKLMGQSPTACSEELVARCRKDVQKGLHLYIGTYVGHYGHFLVDLLSRLWVLTDPAFGDLVTNTKILIHGYGNIDDFYKREYTKVIFDALGIQRENVIIGREPVTLESVIVPRTSFEINNFAHPVYIELCREIGRRILGNTPSIGPRKDIYFSRSRLERGNLRLQDEHLIDEVMREHGIEVYYPEQMSFRDQITVIDNADIVYGLTGSAIHNAVFARSPKKIRCINFGPILNSNFTMIDGMMGNDARYFHESDMVDGEKPATFAGNLIFPNVRQTALQLIESAHAPAPQTD